MKISKCQIRIPEIKTGPSIITDTVFPSDQKAHISLNKSIILIFTKI